MKAQTLTVPDSAKLITTPSGHNLAGLLTYLLDLFDFDARTIAAFREEKPEIRTRFSNLNGKGRYSLHTGGSHPRVFRAHTLREMGFEGYFKEKNGKHWSIVNHDLLGYLDFAGCTILLPALFAKVVGQDSNTYFDCQLVISLADFEEFVIRVILGMETGEIVPDAHGSSGQMGKRFFLSRFSDQSPRS